MFHMLLYFRISPNIIAVILFCTYILPEWGSGPMWPTVVEHHSTLCKNYMWRNIFYVHNYFGFEEMVHISKNLSFRTGLKRIISVSYSHPPSRN